MYYDLSNEAQFNNSTSEAVSISLGPFYISGRQILIGVIVELFALIPSLVLVQLFRRIRSRQKRISPLRAALNEIKSAAETFVTYSGKIAFF